MASVRDLFPRLAQTSGTISGEIYSVSNSTDHNGEAGDFQ